MPESDSFLVNKICSFMFTCQLVLPFNNQQNMLSFTFTSLGFLCLNLILFLGTKYAPSCSLATCSSLQQWQQNMLSFSFTSLGFLCMNLILFLWTNMLLHDHLSACSPLQQWQQYMLSFTFTSLGFLCLNLVLFLWKKNAPSCSLVRLFSPSKTNKICSPSLLQVLASYVWIWFFSCEQNMLLHVHLLACSPLYIHVTITFVLL